ncbi:MAG TPA: phenylacetate--CoA ligase family protein [Candidatus Marinimicrobia bacterium]|nr:phenylacetate--CoA ligase family protein [Candidatus Neomarinimicrobiota bacterium]
MNPLMSPGVLLKVVKCYLFDVDRIWKYSEEKMNRYRDRAFLRILKRAMTIPMYQDKYRNVDLKQIKGLEDIEKLPVVTKDDFREAFPDKLLPKGAKRENYRVMSTSGSTGKPVSIFVEPVFMYYTLLYFTRALKEYGLSWRKSKIALIVDISPGSGEDLFFNRDAVPSVRRVFSLDNIRVYHVGDDPKKIMEDLNKFRPEMIGGYPDILKILAILKEKGMGENVNPKYIASSGAILDGYTRKYMEEVFNARVFETYGATECTPMAIECKKGNMHLQSDIVHMEFWNGKGEHASPGELAEIIITSLVPGGTPVIRYDGVSDLLVLSDKECDCGMHSPVIDRIEGRKVDSIVLPDGTFIPPLAITGIPYQVLQECNSKIIEQFQIVQEDYDRIDILVVLRYDNEKEKEKVFSRLKEEFSKNLKGASVNIKEVKEIKMNRREGLATPPPVVISKVKKD